MKGAIIPDQHLFVCANRREGSPLGPGCSDFGDALYDALKREVSARGLITRTWITKTHCLGICPKHGATIARYRASGAAAHPIMTEVGIEDVPSLLAIDQLEARPGAADIGAEAEATAEAEASPEAAPKIETAVELAIAREIDALEELQRKKVLDLARRLKPGLTMEDVQNPHDFPELDDPDWHYADGVLTGIASVKSTLAALKRGRR